MHYSEKEERGYPWLFFHPSRQWMLSSLVSLVILAISVGFFVWCIRVSDDRGGDSFAGLVFAVASTIFMFLAAVGFSLRRRAHKRSVGGLNAVLNWHICFAVIALVMVFLHAFGNYNPRTGTYALYGMIALVISGIIGRVLDRLVPRLIVGEVHKALTARGEDQVESISQKLQAIVIHNAEAVQGFSTAGENKAVSTLPVSLSGGPLSNHSPFEYKNQSLHTSWDLAYIPLEATPHELSREAGQYRFVPDKKSALTRPDALMPDAQEHIAELRGVERAMQRELFYRYVIRYWRVFHIVLAVVTVGLTLWHIEYALSLVIPALQKFGFNYLLPWP